MPRKKSEGKRTRFNGFQLGESERDRVVADWINAQPNAAESIKALIYAEAIGFHRVAYPVFAQQGINEEVESQVNPDDPRVQTLASLDT